jgi:type I restriction enzyme S subunit
VKRLGHTAVLKARIGWQGLTTAEYQNSGDFYLVTGTDFGNGFINWNNCHFVIKVRYRQDKHIQLKQGDVLVTKDGTIGKVAYVSELPRPATLNSGVFVIRPNGSAFIPKFFYYLLCSRIFTEFLVQLSAGSTINHLYQKDFVTFVYPVAPTLEEQSTIAEVLADVDGLLEALDKLIAKKRAIKQAAMQQLLTGKTRLPGFSGDWEVKRLGEVAHIATGNRNNEDKVASGQYPFFVRSKTVERINTFSYDCEAILVPGEGKIGEIYHYINGRFDVHQRVYAITQISSELAAKFVYYCMMQNFGHWAKQKTVKATVDSLRLPTFRDFEMLLPPSLAEQRAIAEALSDMDAEIEALERRREKTWQVKQGMMQQLLTGRVRLVKPTTLLQEDNRMTYEHV